ncbi:MAG: septum formation inhibitor Maf [Parasporobacterium sp.]|nr:septum formation inhibitor Maf [Parasporobacterium sp.]
MRRIILASKSPRRHELLEMVGIPHEVITSDCDENISSSSPSDMVCKLSSLKAGAVAEALTSHRQKSDDGKETSIDSFLVIGSDTIVYLNGTVLGKPRDEKDAFRMLSELSGNTHSVFTGVTLFDTAAGRKETFFEETKVTFYDVTEKEIADYIKTGDPLDKAGSYGIQGRGAFLVKRIEGDFFTVVGLPVAHLIRTLKEFD